MGEPKDFYQPQCQHHALFREEFIELRQEVFHMTGKIEALIDEHKQASKEVSMALIALKEKQSNPEISKACLLLWGVIITSGSTIITAALANFDKISRFWGGQ